MSSDEFYSDLPNYFTDLDHIRNAFEEAIRSPKLNKDLIIIHGVGGIGKSSLLRMFRLTCKAHRVPVALVSGDEAKSAPQIIEGWISDLWVDGVKMAKTTALLKAYRSVQAKADTKSQQADKQLAELSGKAAGKIAETATSVAVGTALGSILPGIGSLAGALGGMGAEAIVSWLRSQGFKKTDIDIYLDPVPKLTEAFLQDLAEACETQRIVIMLDTFEKLSELSGWLGNLAVRFPENALLVIAGRAIPDWNRLWPTWQHQAYIEELQLMTDETMRLLITRYFAAVEGGEPDPEQVNAIIRFARGLPMVVTAAVSLWTKYKLKDFESIQVQVVADLIDRLKEGVPAELMPALEAAATMRWFDREILKFMTEQADVTKAYDELRRFPFVLSGGGKLAIHDAIRDMMQKYLYLHDGEYYRQLHQRAAKYFELTLPKVDSDTASRYNLERLYHWICTDEVKGIEFFQEAAEQLANHSLVNLLRVLLNDVQTYSDFVLQNKSKAWIKYYQARIAHLEERYPEAVSQYENVLATRGISLKLKGYCLCDLCEILSRWESLHSTADRNKVAGYLTESLAILAPQDTKYIRALWEMGDINRRSKNLEAGSHYYQQAIELVDQHGEDNYVSVRLKQDFVREQMYYGRFSALSEFHSIMFDPSPVYEIYPLLDIDRKEVLAIPLVWMGHYALAEQVLHSALQALDLLEDYDYWREIRRCFLHRSLCYATGLQGKTAESDEHYQTVMDIVSKQNFSRSSYIKAGICGFHGFLLLRLHHLNEAYQELTLAMTLKWGEKDMTGLPELHWFLGEYHEMAARLGEDIDRNLADAANHYQPTDDVPWEARPYILCGAYAGLARVKLLQGAPDAMQEALNQAESIAMGYEYNDHLAGLRLLQAGNAWNYFEAEAILDLYKQALIYALRFNRFLLDEVLSGGPTGATCHGIITVCLEHGEAGRDILKQLASWWANGKNEIGQPREFPVSPLEEGSALIVAEKTARQLEPGDGTDQRMVIKQIESVL